MEIRELLPTDFTTTVFTFDYETTSYFDVVHDALSIQLIQKDFTSPISKTFEGDFFADYLEAPRVFGVYNGLERLGLISVSKESWTNRLRIAEILVNQEHRHQGVGQYLLQHAYDFGQSIGCRELILETQSCNAPAIGAYFKFGFRLGGIDLTHYSNNDIKNKEVRLELTLPIRSQ